MSKYVALLMVAVLASACAAEARVGAMTAAPPATALPADSALHNSVTVRGVSGGEPTNPLWTSQVGNPEFQEALRQSLLAAGMLAPAEGRYRLDAKLVKLDQPWIGFSYTVTSHVQYTLIDSTTSKTVWERTIDAPHTATMSDSMLGVERLRLANEGSIKANISMLIEALIKDAPTLGSSGTPVSMIDMGQVTVQ